MKKFAIACTVLLGACVVTTTPNDPTTAPPPYQPEYTPPTPPPAATTDTGGHTPPPPTTPPLPTTPPVVRPPTESQPAVARVMFWPGKVAQHFNVITNTWETDPDGVTGAASTDAERVAYCRKWYPATGSVVAFSQETISTWRERGNVGAHTATIQSYQCVSPKSRASGLPGVKGGVPRVMFWPGKVAQHFDLRTMEWATDPDGVTGAARDDAERLTHCRKWYPKTTSVRPYSQETIDTWRARGNMGAFTGTMQSYECVAQ